MGAQLNATAISHLEEVSQKGIQDMATSGTVAILLPTTAYVMNLRPPPARQMIEAAVAVALGSDFNPNAHCLAMVGQANFHNSEFQRHFSHLLTL
jgi:imidazolonepropionase